MFRRYVMPGQKRHVLFASDSDDLPFVLGETVRHLIDIATNYYDLDGGEKDDAELGKENVVCIVIITETELKAKQVDSTYAYWNGLFPETPIVWCHGHHNNEWFGKQRRNVTWFDASQPQPLHSLLQTIETIVNID